MGAADWVDVVARLDDLAVADAHDEDAGHRGQPAVRHRELVPELGDYHLGVGGLVKDDIDHPPLGNGGTRRNGEMSGERVAAPQWLDLGCPHRMPDVGDLGVQTRQLVETALGDTVNQTEENLLRARSHETSMDRSCGNQVSMRLMSAILWATSSSRSTVSSRPAQRSSR